MEIPVIFDYLDYRAFLTDCFKHRKQKNPNFSLRYFSAKAGFTSTNFISLVLKGKRNLSHESVSKIAQGFRLNKREREYFLNLVFMNQSEKHEEKNYYYQKMISLKPYTETNQIDRSCYEYFSKWYVPVIKEIVGFGDRKHTPEQIAQILNPNITPKQAEKALNILMQLKQIKKGADGRWEPQSSIVDTGPEIKSLVVANFHREMIKMAAKSIERFPPKMRDISGVVLKVDAASIREIKQKLDSFRKELCEIEANHSDPDRVLYININVFPLTDEIKERR